MGKQKSIEVPGRTGAIDLAPADGRIEVHMANKAADSRGTITQHGRNLRIENALVEEVFTNNRRTGNILISYRIDGQNGLARIETLRLNVDQATVITNQFDQELCLCEIRTGMWIDAEFSSAMTRSIPPQSAAYRIVVRGDSASVSVTTDRVVDVNARNRFLLTGNPYDTTDQIRFVVTNATSILDRNGRPIRLEAIRPGQMVRIEHANFQTASIPPQTTAFRIQLL
ncbi:hypothetical protein HNQ56_004458 [Anaerotaenia torta]|uniref:hypothetical protein n=1 Tax=Anaerotaenia torta TaxID=433293 RepID=UPI003D1A4D4C